MTLSMQISLLTTVNAPYQDYLDANGLACALMSGKIDSGQVASFFTEMSVEDQQSFAEAFDISASVLTNTAVAFSNWSGQAVALAA